MGRFWGPSKVRGMRCAFLALPGELRNEIYRLLLPDTVDQYLERPVLEENEFDFIPLLFVCRQIHVEVLSTFRAYSQLNVIVAEQLAPGLNDDDEEFYAKKQIDVRATKVITAMKHFKNVKIIVCFRPIALRTTHRVLRSLLTLLVSIRAAETDTMIPPRTIGLHTCLHLWRCVPYRSDFDELFNTVDLFKENLVLHCLVPKAIFPFLNDPQYHNIKAELRHLKQKCSTTGIQLVEEYLETPTHLSAMPTCLSGRTKENETSRPISPSSDWFEHYI